MLEITTLIDALGPRVPAPQVRPVEPLAVEVWSEFSETWSSGFDMVGVVVGADEVAIDGVVVRRATDKAILGQPFDLESVRPAAHDAPIVSLSAVQPRRPVSA